MEKLIRHGDLGIIKLSKLPKNLKEKKSKDNKFILALGEVTGHKHVLTPIKESTVKFYEDEKGNHVLEINGTALLTHEEHATIKLDTGIWYQTVQVEYDPLENYKKVID